MNEAILNPPAAVRPAEQLAELLAEATAEHEAGIKAERASLEHYRRAGAALVRAKAAAGHGQWLKTLQRSGIPNQRASEYMRLAEGWGKLPPGGNIALKAALRVIDSDALEVFVRGSDEALSDEAEQENLKILRATHEIAFTLAHFRQNGELDRFHELRNALEWSDAFLEKMMERATKRGEEWQPDRLDAYWLALAKCSRLMEEFMLRKYGAVWDGKKWVDQTDQPATDGP